MEILIKKHVEVHEGVDKLGLPLGNCALEA